MFAADKYLQYAFAFCISMTTYERVANFFVLLHKVADYLFKYLLKKLFIR